MSEPLLSDMLIAALRRIRLLCLDVDGVLTDGTLYLNDRGEEQRAFSVRDGHGLKMIRRHGIEVALLSGRSSALVEHRANELGIELLCQGSTDKAADLKALCDRAGCALAAAAHMGDDLPDLPAMQVAGLGLAPADGHPEVLAAADWVSSVPGGRGAVREICDLLLRLDRPRNADAERGAGT